MTATMTRDSELSALDTPTAAQRSTTNGEIATMSQTPHEWARRAPYKFTEARRVKYLALLRSGSRRGDAARAVGVDRRTVERLMNDDIEFRGAVADAELDATEQIESVLFGLARGGNFKAIEMWLHNRAPDRWSKAPGAAPPEREDERDADERCRRLAESLHARREEIAADAERQLAEARERRIAQLAAHPDILSPDFDPSSVPAC